MVDKTLDKLIKNYRSKTINELLGHKPNNENLEHWSNLVRKSNALEDKLVDRMTIEEMRLMIGQDIGNQFILPFAILELRKNILAEGDMYPGDLLNNILRLSREFWKELTELKEIIIGLVTDNAEVLEGEKVAFSEFLNQIVK